MTIDHPNQPEATASPPNSGAFLASTGATTQAITQAAAKAAAPLNRLPDRWRGLDLTWHPRLRQAVDRVIDWHQARQGALVLAGGYGVGKTHLARVVKDAWGHICLFRGESDLLAEIRDTYRSPEEQGERRLIRRYRDAPLLIIDDLGTAYVKEESQGWYEDILWRILDERASRNTPLLITTNLTLEQLTLRIGGRAADRLAGMMGSEKNYVDLFDIPSCRTRRWSS